MPNGQDTQDPNSGALVHDGHSVGWSLGSEADETSGSGPPEVHYHFPVEIEVRNTVAAIDEDRLIHATLERLARELTG
ncbi:hypothetical protein LMG28688_06244 [Paraburkholderia caffeinitolerans]|uniref:Uncharacterized protein n=1 Tax=Paraburkholderia caffeinitolerans TaxID=1723730 RepID=A0A6J5GXY7_9BURK|nr:hypothetical protein [Paraburkholderia caffeinitolerans]CAB3805742.1 hypothetical protein LMG28688_06244 [Paraburkholderia caffeinitolerans]